MFRCATQGHLQISLDVDHHATDVTRGGHHGRFIGARQRKPDNGIAGSRRCVGLYGVSRGQFTIHLNHPHDRQPGDQIAHVLPVAG